MSKLIDELLELKHSDEYPLHMPGHKRSEKESYFQTAYDVDITEIEGYDNLYEAEGILKTAQESAAKIFGAQQTFFLVNGSTAGILSAVFAAVRREGRILMARNCHKSVYHAACLRGLKTEYVYPDWLEDFSIPGAVSAQEISKILDEFPDIEAVIITSPTYEGIVSDIQAISNIVHKRNIPLIVDEAHGAHFSFHERFPQSAVRQGADIVVQSLHKTLPSFTQTALLHINGTRIDSGKVKRYLSFFQTSSPSYVFMAGMDECIDRLAQEKGHLWDGFFILKDWFEWEMKKRKHIRIFTEDDTASVMDRKVKTDPCKIVISVKGTNMTGHMLQRCLLERYHIQVEMAGMDYVVAIVTMNDTKEGFERFLHALVLIDEELDFTKNPIEEHVKDPLRQMLPPKRIFTLSDAEAYETEWILLKEAGGRVAADFMNLYPPGIPIVAPGEQITDDVVNIVAEYLLKDFTVQGIRDNKISVIITNYEKE